MNAGVKRLGDLAADFAYGGGQIEGPVRDKRRLAAWRRGLRARQWMIEEERFKMVEDILSCEDPDMRDVYVALDDRGRAVGAVLANEWNAYQNIQVEFLGATGGIRGTGAALLVKVAVNAPEGWALGVDGKDAEEWYKGLGMVKPPKGAIGVSHWWGPKMVDEVRGMAAPEVELATP